MVQDLVAGVLWLVYKQCRPNSRTLRAESRTLRNGGPCLWSTTVAPVHPRLHKNVNGHALRQATPGLQTSVPSGRTHTCHPGAPRCCSAGSQGCEICAPPQKGPATTSFGRGSRGFPWVFAPSNLSREAGASNWSLHSGEGDVAPIAPCIPRIPPHIPPENHQRKALTPWVCTLCGR